MCKKTEVYWAFVKPDKRFKKARVQFCKAQIFFPAKNSKMAFHPTTISIRTSTMSRRDFTQSNVDIISIQAKIDRNGSVKTKRGKKKRKDHIICVVFKATLMQSMQVLHTPEASAGTSCKMKILSLISLRLGLLRNLSFVITVPLCSWFEYAQFRAWCVRSSTCLSLTLCFGREFRPNTLLMLRGLLSSPLLPDMMQVAFRLEMS